MQMFPNGICLPCRPAGTCCLCSRFTASSLLLSSLELSDTKVYEPYIRALLGTASHFCEGGVPQVTGSVQVMSLVTQTVLSSGQSVPHGAVLPGALRRRPARAGGMQASLPEGRHPGDQPGVQPEARGQGYRGTSLLRNSPALRALPQGPRRTATVGSYGGFVSYERGTTLGSGDQVSGFNGLGFGIWVVRFRD